MIVSEFDLVLRLVISIGCGMLIGNERKNRSKEAGIRTHIIICLGSCLMMIVSKYGFSDLIFADGAKYDPARIAAQVVSGIGFLGAGMILVKRQTISGLTTAAGMWATSGVGIAIGSGLLKLGIGTAACIVVVQWIFHLEFTRPQYHEVDVLNVVVEADKISLISTYLEKKSIRYEDLRVERLDNHLVCCELHVTITNNAEREAILMMITADEAIKKVEVVEG
ncbi:MAG: MgtC/SapB family protein [Erysipelotrichales bacterium]|nr:MgtC/SapB family protein [Erysipelotrichales bacterium]